MLTEAKFAISAEFFNTNKGKQLKLYPPKEVFLSESRKMSFESITEQARGICYYSLFRDVSPFIPESLDEIIQKNHLLSFAYGSDNFGHSEELMVVITTAKEVWFEWQRGIWPWLLMQNPDVKKEMTVRAKFDSRGNYQILKMGNGPYSIGSKTYFKSSEFTLAKLETIAIKDTVAFDAMESELRCFVEPE